MDKYSRDAGFSIVEGLGIIAVLAMLGFAGFFVWHAKHTTHSTTTTTSTHGQTLQNSNRGIYPYAGYSFPIMPADFTEVDKTASNFSGTAEIDYSSTRPLAAIESEAIHVCKVNNYQSHIRFTTETSTSIDGDKSYNYDYSCNTATNDWQFDVTADAKANIFDVSIMSGPDIAS